MKNPNHNITPRTPFGDRKRKTYQRNFEVELSQEQDSNLNYFMQQELAYYNAIVERLTPRLRTFPKDFLSIKDKELALWEVCAEFAVNPNNMAKYPNVEAWPNHLKPYFGLLFDSKGLRISTSHLSIFEAASTPARIHASVRKNIAVEILKHMLKQADSIASAQKTEVLKTPMQLLNTYTIETKRHLQIPSKLVKMTYDENIDSTNISIPYSKFPIIISGNDLSESRYSFLVIRSTHPDTKIWNVELKDSESKYMLTLTDYIERKKLGSRSYVGQGLRISGY